MRGLTNSGIKMALICTGMFLSGGVVAIAAVAIYGKNLNDKENVQQRLECDYETDDELEKIIDSQEGEA